MPPASEPARGPEQPGGRSCPTGAATARGVPVPGRRVTRRRPSPPSAHHAGATPRRDHGHGQQQAFAFASQRSSPTIRRRRSTSARMPAVHPAATPGQIPHLERGQYAGPQAVCPTSRTGGQADRNPRAARGSGRRLTAHHGHQAGREGMAAERRADGRRHTVRRQPGRNAGRLDEHVDVALVVP